MDQHAAQIGGSWASSALRSVFLACLRLAGPRPGEGYWIAGVLSGGSGDVGGDDVGGVAVQRGAGPVIAHGRAWVGVGSGFLDVAQRNPGVQTDGDERMPQRVWADRLGDPGAAGDAADDPPGAVAVQPAPIGGQEDRPFAAITDGQVNCPGGARASGMVTTLPPLRVMTSVRWPRSMPSASMSAPIASETRSPFRASSEIRACSVGGPGPAATSRAPSSLRSSPVAWDS
jgi:hypothetical protein